MCTNDYKAPPLSINRIKHIGSEQNAIHDKTVAVRFQFRINMEYIHIHVYKYKRKRFRIIIEHKIQETSVQHKHIALA